MCYVLIWDTQHSSVTVHWERFQENQTFCRECSVTVVIIYTRKKAGSWHIWNFFHTFCSCFGRYCYRLLGTRGQHPQPRFCRFQTVMRNGVKDSCKHLKKKSIAIDRPVIFIHFSSALTPSSPINKTHNFGWKKIFFKLKTTIKALKFSIYIWQITVQLPSNLYIFTWLFMYAPYPLWIIYKNGMIIAHHYKTVRS